MQITKDELAALREPFSPDEIEWRAIRWTRDDSAALPFAYLTARSVVKRLDSVFPGEANIDTEVLPSQPDRAVVKATITIRGVSRSGIGEAVVHYTAEGSPANEPFKSAESDAIKRAAANWGIGAYLYELPDVWIGWQGNRSSGRFTENPASVLLNPDGTIKDRVEKPTQQKASNTKAKTNNNQPTRAQIAWLAEYGIDASDMTREQALAEMIKIINNDEQRLSLAQLKLIVSLQDERGFELPDFLTLTPADASKFISSIINA